MSTPDFEKKYALAVSHIESSPQFQNGVIREEDALNWLEAVKLSDPERIDWHAKRLSGFGSSDIGHLVLSLREEYDPFKDAAAVVLEKLMKSYPSPEGGDTKRGLFLEPVVRDEFIKMVGGKRRDDLVEGFTELRVEGHPWMVGNPDDIIEIDGKLIVVDYKVPRPSTLEDREKQQSTEFSYVCQLHHLLHIGRSNKMKLDGMAVVPFDTNEWRAKPRIIEYNNDLMNEIIRAGDLYWNEYVMKGLVPPFVIKPTFDTSKFSDEQLERMNELSARFLTAKMIEKASKTRCSQIVEEIVSMTQPFNLEDARINLPGGTISAKISVDKTLVLEYGKKLGIDFNVDDLENPDDLDTIVADVLEKIIQTKDEHGLDVSKLFKEEHGVALTRAKKGTAAEIRDKEKDHCTLLIEGIINDRNVEELITSSIEVQTKTKRSPK